MADRRRFRLLLSGLVLLLFLVPGAVSAWQRDQRVASVVLGLLAVVVAVVALRSPGSSGPDPRAVLLRGTLGFGFVGVLMLVLCVVEDDLVGRLLSGSSGVLFLAMAGFTLWARNRAGSSAD